MADFEIQRDGYLTFDAFTIKQHIKNALNQGGLFTDQNYEGSYMSTIIDIVSYTFHVLMFYLNKTSTESMFTEAQLYENINRIVKLLDYKPVGYTTSILSFNMTATSNLTSNQLYVIPRYSYLSARGVPFSFNEDIAFTKNTPDEESISEVSNNKLLFQGQWREYSPYTAKGEANELMFVVPGSNVKIDHYNIDVYVKSIKTGKWAKYDRSPSLYLDTPFARRYEIRFNENKYYEIKFGNNINGVQLNEGDVVAVYYLETKLSGGEIGVNALSNSKLRKFITSQLTQILLDVNETTSYSYISDANLNHLLFTNNSISTYSSNPETVDEIKTNAPSLFRSQYRLVTQQDYESFIKQNFSQLQHDVAVMNNWEYVSTYLKYFYDTGLSNPSNASRTLYNQLQFADACNFNNVYVFIVPKNILVNDQVNYLSASYKQLITNSMAEVKTLTTEPIVMDPVYISFSICAPQNSADFVASKTDADNSYLEVIKSPQSKRDNSSIAKDIALIFQDYFTGENCSLGQVINITQLNADILTVNGVANIYTVNNITGNKYEGLTLLKYDPIYPESSRRLLYNNYSLDQFMFPYLEDIPANKIRVVSNATIYENVEY